MVTVWLIRAFGSEKGEMLGARSRRCKLPVVPVVGGGLCIHESARPAIRTPADLCGAVTRVTVYGGSPSVVHVHLEPCTVSPAHWVDLQRRWGFAQLPLDCRVSRLPPKRTNKRRIAL